MNYTSDELLLIATKEAEYKEYIANHIKNVQTAWVAMKTNEKCMEIIHKAFKNQGFDPDGKISAIDRLITNHDKSKYSKAEFDGYRKRFYPINATEAESYKEEFDKAWAHHWQNNLHHWNAWTPNVSSMPLVYVVEMVCDWIAMSEQFPQDKMAWGWYKNHTNIELGTAQRKLTEELLLSYYGYEE